MGTSTRPVLLILPTREKIFVPLLPSVPNWVNQSAPLLMMSGTLAHVSTLFNTLGRSQSPLILERMYFGRGSPTLPSRAVIRAVDSPHTKAPAPWCTITLNSNPDPRIFSPRKPYSCACWMARLIFCTARGYSWRTYMYPSCAPIAKPPMIKPSRMECGLPSSKARSINAPGSPSSALTITYLMGSSASREPSHFLPAGKPAPPRPRRFDFFTSIRTSSADMSNSALVSAEYPSMAR